jgi:two-component system, chemotaxis family, sensor kinase CheA
MLHARALSGAAFEAVFPFYVALDRGGRVVGAGPALRRLDPAFGSSAPFKERFRVVRPAVEPTFEAMTEREHDVFVLESVTKEGLILRGQVVLAEGGEQAFFLGSPWVRDLGALAATGLLLSDFAAHDPVVDWLFALQAQKASLADATLLAEELAELNVELERRVRERTIELRQANESLERILESMGQGFVGLDREGRMSAERSAVLDRWLGPAAPGAYFGDYLEPYDAQAAALFRMAWADAAEGAMPAEVCVEAMPKRVVARGRTLELAYRTVSEGGAVARGHVVLSDVTDRVERERVEARQRELFGALQAVRKDPAGFGEFMAEARAILERLGSAGGDPVAARRDVHTLKGGAGAYGLVMLPALCGELEARLGEGPRGLRAEELEGLRAAWVEVSDLAAGVLGEGDAGALRVGADEYAAALRALDDGEAPERVAAVLRSWRHEPVRVTLARLGEHARAFAAGLGRGELGIDVEAADVRLDPARWRGFFASLVHVVRNAVDHGLEAPDERRRAGKAPCGRLRLGARIEGDRFVLEVADDGRGVDWARVAAKAAELGLPFEAEAERTVALFADGLSTKDVATEVSGRGVGLAAVWAACKALGGQARVDSWPGAGMRVCFDFPATLVSEQAG